MSFIITNGSSYCHRNKTRAVEIVDTIDQATKFPSKEAAERLLARATKKLAGYHIEEAGTEQNRTTEKGKKAAANSTQKRGRRRKNDAADTQQAAAPDEAVNTGVKTEKTELRKKSETAQTQENPEAEKNQAGIPDGTKAGGKTAATQGRKRRTRRKSGKESAEPAPETNAGRDMPETNAERETAEAASKKETGKEPAPTAEKDADKNPVPVTDEKEAEKEPAPAASEKEAGKEISPAASEKEAGKEAVPAASEKGAGKETAPAVPAGFNFKVTVHQVGSSRKKEISRSSKAPEKQDAPAETGVPAAPPATPASTEAPVPEKKAAPAEAPQPQSPVIKPFFTVTTTTVGQKQAPAQSKKAEPPAPEELPAAAENVSASGANEVDTQPADSQEAADRRRRDRRASKDQAADRENSDMSRQDLDLQSSGRSRKRRGNNRLNPAPAADTVQSKEQAEDESPYEDVFTSESQEKVRGSNRSEAPARNNAENTVAAGPAVQPGSGRSRRRNGSNGSVGQRLGGTRSTRNPAKAMANQTDLRRRFTQEERNLIYNRTEGHCGICGRFIPLEEYTIDHIVPLSKGGTNDLDNLQACCGFCNKAKDDSMGDEFFKRIEHIFLYQAKLKFGKKQAKRLKKTIRELEDEVDEI